MKRIGSTPTRGPEQTGSDWRRQAVCGDDPALFFPDGDTGPWRLVIDEAKRICKTQCPVLEECRLDTLRLERGLGHTSRFGIAAGLEPKERAALDPTPRRINQNA